MVFFSHGIDPARHMHSSDDFTGVVVHRLDAGQSIPKMQAIRKLAGPYPDQMHVIESELFAQFPPSIIVVDYTTEKTIAELLKRKNYHVDAVSFTTAAKLQLKQCGLQVLQSGYVWPTPSNPVLKELVEECKEQLRREQIIHAANSPDKISFDHPPGSHNDLAIAWELSIKGVIEYGQAAFSYKVRGL